MGHPRSDILATSALAWINCWPKPEELRTFKEFDLYWQGASAEARRGGYRLDEFACPAELSPARLQQVLRTRSIRGLLITPGWSGATPDWGGFDWGEFCVVRFGCSLESPAAHVVTSDQLTDIPEVPGMLARAGRRVPEDLGLAALSVLDGGADAGINQNSEAIGAAAVQLLISLIHHHQRGIPEIPREVLIPGRWVDGATLPPKGKGNEE